MDKAIQEEITAFMQDVATLADQVVDQFASDHPIGKLARDVQDNVKNYRAEVEREDFEIHIGTFKNLVLLSFSAPISYVLLNEEQVGFIITGLTNSLVEALTYDPSEGEHLH